MMCILVHDCGKEKREREKSGETTLASTIYKVRVEREREKTLSFNSNKRKDELSQ
jgi:hypothetical protein